MKRYLSFGLGFLAFGLLLAGSSLVFAAVPHPATVSSITPNSGSTAGGTSVTISGAHFKLGGPPVDAVTSVTIGGISVAFSVVSSSSLTATTPAHAAGAVDVVVTNTDGSGTLVGGFTYTAADITPPSLLEVTSVTTPTKDNTPDYTFSSNEIGTISYGGDCASATTAAVSGNNTITFNTLADGVHSNCTITVTDASTNASTPLPVSVFTVDTTAPAIPIISSPLNNARVNSSGVNVNGTAEANTAIQITGGASTANTTADGSGNWNTTVSLNFGAGVDTTNNLSVTATDAALNTSLAANLTVVMDNTNPTVLVASAASNPTNTSPIPVTVTFNEDVTDFDISDVTVSNGNAGSFSSSDAQHYSLSITPSGDPITVTVSVADSAAHDAAGNNNNASNVLSRGYDGTAPSVTIDTGPTEGSSINTVTPVFTFTMTGGTSLECQEDGGAYGTCSGDPTSHTMSALLDGPHSFSVKAIDGVNPDSIATVNFTVDTIAPTVSISSPLAGSTTGASGTIIYTVGDSSGVVCTLDGSTVSCDNSGSFLFGSLTSGPHTFTVEGTDSASNINNASVTWNVDATPPVITANGSLSMSVRLGTVYVDPGATADDAVDGPVSVTPSGTVNTSVLGTYLITYNAVDAHSNAATPVIRTVVVSRHTGGAGETQTSTITNESPSPATPQVLGASTETPSPAPEEGKVLGESKFVFTLFLKMGPPYNLKTKGPEVMELEKVLTSLGFYKGAIDGKFGKEVQAGVKAYQKANPPLKVDGIVGPLTRAVLNK